MVICVHESAINKYRTGNPSSESMTFFPHFKKYTNKNDDKNDIADEGEE